MWAVLMAGKVSWSSSCTLCGSQISRISIILEPAVDRIVWKCSFHSETDVFLVARLQTNNHLANNFKSVYNCCLEIYVVCANSAQEVHASLLIVQHMLDTFISLHKNFSIVCTDPLGKIALDRMLAWIRMYMV